MFEKIKAWIKRKRETAREQQAAEVIYNNWDMAAARGTATRKNDSIYIAAIIRPE